METLGRLLEGRGIWLYPKEGLRLCTQVLKEKRAEGQAASEVKGGASAGAPHVDDCKDAVTPSVQTLLQAPVDRAQVLWARVDLVIGRQREVTFLGGRGTLRPT